MQERIRMNATRVNENRNSPLAVGHTPYTDPSLVHSLLTIRVPHYPDLKVQLHSDFAFDLVQSLVAGELDLALVAWLVAWPPESATLKFIEVAIDPLFVVLPDYHPSSDNHEVSLSDLVNDHWIIFNKRVHPVLYDAILQQAIVYGISPKEIHHIVTPDEGIHLVLDDAGVAFLAKSAALSNQRLGTVVKPLAEDRLQITTYLAMHADSPLIINDFAQEFLRKCAANKT